jgi:hypothetical protein
MLSSTHTLRSILVGTGCFLGILLVEPAAALSSSGFVDRRSFARHTVSAILTTTTVITTNETIQAADTGEPSIGSATRPASASATKGGEARNDLQRRMIATILEKPKLVPSPLASSGIDNLFYPDFLAGTWDVAQTLTSVEVPLGLEFLNPDKATAERSLAEARTKLNEPVSLQLRYVPTRWGIVEDRVYNTASRLNAFAGRTVVAAVQYADVNSSNRDAVLRQGGSEDDPLTTVLVRYKGPAAQKIFVTTHSSVSCDDESCVNRNEDDEPQGGGANTPCSSCWVASESQRSIFALTNENPAPPIFTDSEVLYEFRLPASQPENNIIHGRLRIASYLNPMDKLYFDAQNRAVSIQDYTLEMRRTAAPPAGSMRGR